MSVCAWLLRWVLRCHSAVHFGTFCRSYVREHITVQRACRCLLR